MTTPLTTIATSDVNAENGYAGAQQISFDDAIVRSLAGITTPGAEKTLYRT